MAQIFLVRHGKRMSMDYQSGLSKIGRLHAKYLSQRFKKASFTKIYVSRIERARETAQSIIRYHKKTPIIHTDLLNEVRSTLVGGKVGEDIGRVRNDRKRAAKAYEEIFLKAKKDDRILVVCHGNLIRYFLNKILHSPKLDLWHNIHIDSSSVNIIEGFRNIWTIKTLNNMDHLEDSLKKKFYNKESVRN